MCRQVGRGTLRAEIQRLRRWYRPRGHDVDGTWQDTTAYAKAQAVRMLSELVLRDAQERADAASEIAVKDYRYHSGGGHAAELEEMERRVAWLRAFCHAIQVQLHAATDAFSREVDELAHFPDNVAARREDSETELRVFTP